MERRLTSEQIDQLLDEIVTDDFIIHALKEFNVTPEFQQTHEVAVSKIERLKKAEKNLKDSS